MRLKPEVGSAAANFSEKLQAVLPSQKEDPSEDWPAFPFIKGELGLQNMVK